MAGVGIADRAASASEEAFDGGGCFVDLGVEGFIAFVGGVVDAVAKVFVDEPDAHALEGLGDRADLGQDVDALGVLVDHALESSDLAFDAAQSIQVVLFGKCVARHDSGFLLGVDAICLARCASERPVASAAGGRVDQGCEFSAHAVQGVEMGVDAGHCGLDEGEVGGAR